MVRSAARACSLAHRHMYTAGLTGLFVLTALVCGVAVAQPLPPDRPDFPSLTLDGPLSGQAAVLALGDDLAAVAAYYRMPADVLAALLQNEPTARIDGGGRIYFVENGLRQPLAASTAASSQTTGSLDRSRTFNLSSLPRSNRSIYRDFDGHSITGEEWNNGARINAGPWDIDGRPGQFSDQEHRIIQAVWQRVAEDFAPFDVNVTTREPAESDLIRDSRNDGRFGMRVVITPNTFYDCDCGGVAYLSVFDYFGSNPGRYQPAWVFNSSEETIAEAVSHEAGHTLGLRHDGVDSDPYYRGHGSGATSWAPIMGISYGQAVTQWSRGEYAGANNTQDDIATMPDNGAALRLDDAGDGPNTANRLQVRLSGGTQRVEHTGTMTRDNDTDWLMFVAGAGPAAFTVEPGPIRPNLDIRIDLIDSDGVVLADASPHDRLGASLAVELGGGTFYLVVDGVGTGDPTVAYSDYGSIGAYRITGSYPDTDAQPPVARFSTSPEQGGTPQWVSTDASDSQDPDGRIVDYRWDFGDGRIAEGPQAYCTYSQPGTYMISLTVRDNDGLGDALRKAVTITTTPSVSTVGAPVTAATEGDPLNQCMPGEQSEQSGNTNGRTNSTPQGNQDDPVASDDDPAVAPDAPSSAGSGAVAPWTLLLLLVLTAGRYHSRFHAAFRFLPTG